MRYNHTGIRYKNTGIRYKYSGIRYNYAEMKDLAGQKGFLLFPMRPVCNSAPMQINDSGIKPGRNNP